MNESFVRRFFAGRNPVGQRIRLGGPDTKEPWRTIVGIAPDLYVSGADNREPDGLYLPLAQSPQRALNIALLTGGRPLALTPAVRREVAATDPDLPIFSVASLAGAIDDQTWAYDLFGGVFMVFGFVALFLAAVGLYGVMAFAVSRREREIGIRMAVGAQRTDVLGLILRQGFGQIGVGLLLGLVLALGVSHFVTMLLFQVQPRDPGVFAAVIGTLLIVGAAACLVPAQRAMRVDPLRALHG